MITVYLHGWLGKQYGKQHRIVATSAREAVDILRANFDNFEHKVREGFYVVRYGKAAIDETQLDDSSRGRNIHIAPHIMGSGRGPLKIIAGAVLVGVGFFFGGALGLFAPFVMQLGVGLVLTGVSMMLAPSPIDNENSDERNNPLYAGAGNATGQGAAVPVGFGRFRCPGHVVSLQVRTVDSR